MPISPSQETPSIKGPWLLDLPVTMVVKRLSFLEPKDLQACVSESQRVFLDSVWSADIQAREPFQRFVDEVQQVDREIPLDIPLLSRNPLRTIADVQQNALRIHFLMICQLMDVNDQKFSLLQDKMSGTAFNRKLLDTAKICRKVPNALNIVDENSRAEALCQISESFVLVGELEKAIEIAMQIPDPSVYRERALGKIFDALTQAGRVEEANKIAMKMCSRGALLNALDQALGSTRSRQFEQAMGIAMQTPDQSVYLARAKSNLSKALAKAPQAPCEH